ncbi:hypothetical protein [Phosphitispora sp. TUW77]|uniref:hypothetical protein n=1 Tax=Phosphitispora sp. TUW77 TaxID=3152361 RepID=UPI003AB2B175
MKKLAVLLITTALLLSFIGSVQATPDKAEKSGKSCSECHSRISHKPFGNN